ncbi:uncharacterized protein LOC117188099 isoform X1 [Drosophila miranda]|uniref:uncharacterized protein LOC117188099 isoform X1 n=1 Tax=Drosophila miranda TaxID=7229 RepID=UPI0007E6FE34|nr:uncharacterized protein LOC117188099 isoform X1 [Drosophila miranda]
MDFQSAMETFAEAWVAANAGQQSQALALTRAANAAAVVAAANAKSPSASVSAAASLVDMAVKKEHSLSPPHSVVGVAGEEVTAMQHRRSSLQGVQEKLTQLQMQHHQQQQQQQQQHHHHQLQQQQQQQLQQQQHQQGGGVTGEGGGRRSAEGSPSTIHPAQQQQLQHQQHVHNSDGNALSSSTASSSQNATPKSERDREREERVERGSISCLPPAALGMTVGVQQAQQQAEKLLSHPALDSRRDFDISKVNPKSLPLHCVVESVHSLHASLTIDSRQPWKRRPNIETDSYVIIAAATPWSEIVQTALQRLGYSQEVANTARGSLIIKHWKPIPLEQISDNPAVPVSDIVGELTSVITLRIVILRPKTSPFGEIKDKLLKLLVLQSHAVLRSTGCPLDEVTLSQICRSSHQNTYAMPGGEMTEDLRRKFDQWWSNQLSPQAAMAPKMLPFMTAPSAVPVPVPGDMDFPVGSAMAAAAAAAAAHAAAAGGAAVNNPLGSMGSRESLLLANEAAVHHATGGQAAAAGHHSSMLVHPMHAASMHHHHHHGATHGHGPQYPNQKTRMRTSFDPEMELPKLQKWFQENPHPSRQQIQTYVVQLNTLESRRGRKPLDVNNVVYWFKNARAAQKRAEMRGGSLGSAMSALGHAAMNGYLSQHAPLGQNSSSSAGSQPMSMGNLSMTHDYLKSPMSLKSEDIDTMSQHSDEMEEEPSRPNTPQLPLSLTTHERNRSSPLMDQDEEEEEDQGDQQQPQRVKSAGSEVINGNLRETEEERQEKASDVQDNEKESAHHVVEVPHSGAEPLVDAASSQNNNNNSSSHSHIEHEHEVVSSTPKRTIPKEEEDDLDMDDDEEDNENDVSHLDEFRSPSPDLSGAVAPHKDQLPFPMVPNSMFSQSFMYMSHYIPAFGQAAAAHPHHHAAAAAAAAGIQPNALMGGGGGLNLSSISNEERRKRNRTFIDPVTEVPKLEQWFAMNTHPSHNLILKYTEDLNTMPYRQKFPRLESKNVQFWFKNRRAKCKRLKMSLYDNNQCGQLGGLSSFVPKYEERD